MRLHLAALLIASATGIADSALQTDWSGGPGAYGPLSGWYETFQSESGTYWYAAGSLELSTGVVHTVEGSFKGAYGACADDVDGDGDTDISAVTGSELVWWENLDGSGQSWALHTVDPSYEGAYDYCAGDVDGDGDTDLIGASSTTVMWWDNADGTGTSWTCRVIDGFQGGTVCLRLDDVDQDGYTDVLAAAQASNTITWYRNADGSGNSWVENTVDDDFNAASSVFCDDMDGDGDRDLLGTALGDDEVVWWENLDGVGGSWTIHVVDDGVSTPWSTCTFDMDGDGDRDVLAASFNGWSIVCWENTDGTGTAWTEHLVDGNLFGPNRVMAVDLDGDGIEDVLGSAYYGSIVAWWKTRTGCPDDWHRETLTQSLSGAYDVDTGDISGDGEPDVLAAGCFDELAWWDMGRFLPGGVLESGILSLGYDPDWGSISWSGSMPGSTSVAFQVRASDDWTQMGNWSGLLTSPCALDGILTDGMSCVQYRALLSTLDPGATPVLDEVTLTWDPMGAGEGGGAPAALYGAVGNPSARAADIRFSLGSAATVSLTVFDAAGRVVEETVREFPRGLNGIAVSGLAPGVYFVRMSSGNYSAVRGFTVVE